MKVHLLLICLFGILNAFALTDKHEEESKESSDQAPNFLKRSDEGYGLRTKLANRIIGGKEAGKNEFPWMTAIMTTDSGYWGGGTLFTPRNVLTAAYCFGFGRKNLTEFRIKLATYYVVLGKHYLNITEPQEQIFGVDDLLKLEPGRDKSGVPLFNDLAVLKLNGTATINRYVSTICLANYPVYHGDTVTIIGWGMTKFKTYHDKTIVTWPNISNVLMVAKTQVLRREDCSNYKHPKDKNGNVIVMGQQAGEDIICTYGENDEGLISNGDNGSPLLFYDPIAERYEQVGIAATSYGRSGEQHFSNVSYFLEKIEEMVTDMDKN